MNERKPRRLFRLPFREGGVEEEVDDEIRFHLERRAARFEAEGMTPEEARAAAEARFGDVRSVKGEVERTMRRNERAEKKSDVVDSIRRDLSFAMRQLIRNPGFSSIAILTGSPSEPRRRCSVWWTASCCAPSPSTTPTNS